MTANAFEEDKRDAIAAGMNGHIAKPIQVDKLLSILSEVIRKQSLYRLKNGTMGKTDDVLPIMDILVSRLVCFEFGLWFVMEDCR